MRSQRRTRIGRMLERQWRENLFLFRTWLMLNATSLALRFANYRKVRKLFSHELKGRPWSPESIGWAVTTAARYTPGAKCLAQAILAETLLFQSGFAAQIHVGVAKPGDSNLRAHAWVECDGVVVVGEDEKNAELQRLGAFQS